MSIENRILLDYQRVSTVFAQIKRVARLSKSKDSDMKKIRRMIDIAERRER